MIVLDTNQLPGVHGNATLTMLRAVAHMTGHRLALPQVAIMEHLDQFERSYARRVDELIQAQGGEDVDERWRAVLAKVPRYEGINSWNSTGVGKHSVPTPASARSMRERRIQTLFRVLDPPDGHADEALRRESSRIPPAKESGDSGKGARDVSIWLTVLEAAKGHPGNVYFVSKDGGFQNESGGLLPELIQECRRSDASNVVYCPDVNDLLHRLSCDATPPAHPCEVMEAVLESRTLESLVSDHTGARAGRTTSHEIDSELVKHPDVPTADFSLQPERDEASIERCKVEDSRRIGDTTLVAIDVVWNVTRYYRFVPSENVYEVPFTLRTSLLVKYEPTTPTETRCFYRWPARWPIERPRG